MKGFIISQIVFGAFVVGWMILATIRLESAEKSVEIMRQRLDLHSDLLELTAKTISESMKREQLNIEAMRLQDSISIRHDQRIQKLESK